VKDIASRTTNLPTCFSTEPVFFRDAVRKSLMDFRNSLVYMSIFIKIFQETTQ